MSNGLSRRLSRVTQSVPTIERSPEYSDDAIALKVAERFEGDFLYVASWKQWLRWDGHRYRVDDTLKVFDSVRGVARSIANGCNDPRQAKAIAGATTIAGVERLARSDPRLSASAFEFDVDPMKMNTPDGIIDLETGGCQPSRREDRVTKVTAAGLGDHCPRWRQFLCEITDGDDELQGYLARVFGYALTGSVRENAFFFCYGLGANGKTVLIETMAKVLGDYALPAPIEMFTLSKMQGHTTDIAGLQGARMITASETEAGRALAEARIKLLTGGEKVSARRMRADNTAFEPQFKLFLTGNHKPRISSNDEAIRRRIHLVPFTTTIPPWQRDQRLPEKLIDEWPGILGWAVQGCLDWQRQGLNPPGCVREATDDYLNAEDVVLGWLSSCVEFDPNATASTQELFGSWGRFAEAAQEPIGPQKEFVKALRGKNLILDHTRNGNRWIGLRLKEKAQ
ncbi:MAG: phage/plasmid primase, P4 family [Xanthobacteraceae bacterium]